MHILIGIIVVAGGFLAGLYYWLSGHWFARVLAFLGFGIIGMLATGAFIGLGIYERGTAPGGVFIFIPLGLVPAWFVASIPIYVQRHKERQERYELAALDLRLLSQEPVGPQLQITQQPRVPRWWDNPT